MLGVNLFLFVGACAFFFNIDPILDFYFKYEGVAFIANIVLVGFFSTFFSKAGFIGVEYKGTFMNSLLLLGLCFGALIWACLMNNHGILITAATPFIILKIISERF